MEIKYDTPIEVTEAQYMHKCAGVVCGQTVENKCYIKVWLMKYAYLVEKIILGN